MFFRVFARAAPTGSPWPCQAGQDGRNEGNPYIFPCGPLWAVLCDLCGLGAVLGPAPRLRAAVTPLRAWPARGPQLGATRAATLGSLAPGARAAPRPAIRAARLPGAVPGAPTCGRFRTNLLCLAWLPGRAGKMQKQAQAGANVRILAQT